MSDKGALVREVTRRLLISLLTLIALSAALLIVFVLAQSSVSVFAITMTFGICGGFVGIQRRLKSLPLEDLELMASSWAYVFLSPLAGGALAVILYLLFVSGLVKGGLFPTFEPGETLRKDFTRILDCTASGYQDYAKIMFWSFVAGFSETFVTDIIGTFSKAAPPQTGGRSNRRD
jgi:hypothetical protein